MKQHTVWHWHSETSPGNYIKIGVVHNNKSSCPEDVVRIKAVSSKPGYGIDYQLRVDEAMTLVAGLSKTLSRMIYLGGKQLFIDSAWKEEV